MTVDLPIYKTIYNNILNDIENNAYISGKLPSEAEFCKIYNASRMTVNKALSFLTQAGYIYRVRGKGSFVKNREVSKIIEESKSFTEDINRLGGKPGSKVLVFKTIKGSTVSQIAKWLNVPQGGSLFYFVRIRTTDEKPIAISETYLSKAVIQRLPITALEKSLYAYLRENLHIYPRCSNFILQAKLPTAWEKKALDGKNEALLKVTHLSYTQQGEPFEYNLTSYLGSKYFYVTNQALEPIDSSYSVNILKSMETGQAKE